MKQVRDAVPLLRYDGFTASDLAELTGAPRVELRATAPSVMDVGHDLAERGAPSGTLVVADEQTAGRGRQGRRWHSPAGCGVWAAMVLVPREPFVPGAFALRSGAAVLKTVRRIARIRACLKWPNDIVVGGRKLAGVLCEAKWRGMRAEWVCVGVGINVRGELPEELRETATTVAAHVQPAGRAELLAGLASGLRAVSELGGPLSAAECEEMAREVGLALGGPSPVIEPDGTLVVPGPDGTLDRFTMPL